MDSLSNKKEINVEKRVQRFSHANVVDMMELLQAKKCDQDKLTQACRNIHHSCAICSSTGMPADKKRIPTSHVNEAFNE